MQNSAAISPARYVTATVSAKSLESARWAEGQMQVVKHLDVPINMASLSIVLSRYSVTLCSFLPSFSICFPVVLCRPAPDRLICGVNGPAYTHIFVTRTAPSSAS